MMTRRTPSLWLIVLSWVACDTTHALARVTIRVRPIAPRDTTDVRALADLRFDEWIAGIYNDTSRSAFQAATAELYQERAAQGAVAFLACSDSDDEVMGAGELSPIELEGVIGLEHQSSSRSHKDPKPQYTALYVTDVVTAKRHRRKGVALAIMQAMEDYAQNQVVASCLLLHVRPTNAQAMAFYTNKAGYFDELSIPSALCLDAQRLAENSGTTGQVLLCKPLELAPSEGRVVVKNQSKGRRPRRQGGGGFG